MLYALTKGPTGREPQRQPEEGAATWVQLPPYPE